MDFEFTEEEESFREEVRKFLKRELTPELQEELKEWEGERHPHRGIGPHMREFGRKLGETGWLGIAWPKEYGGLGQPFMKLFIFLEELRYHKAQIPNIFAVTMVGPALLLHGSEEQKREFLPKIVKGELEFALGYTEPQAGTDLASLELRAVEDGDDYVLNGQKSFNTGCHLADFHWLAARTDTTVPKHRGISIFIVDLKSPGITIRPIQTLGGGRTNEVFYDDVRVPRRNLVGEKNKGWLYMTSALAFERVMCFGSAHLQKVFEDLVQYVKECSQQGRTFATSPIIRHKLAQMFVQLEVSRLFCYQAAWLADKGDVTKEASVLKIFVTELAQSLTNTGMQVLKLYGQLRRDSKWSPLEGEIEEGYRAAIMHTFGAGTNEILKDAIAIRELGLPTAAKSNPTK